MRNFKKIKKQKKINKIPTEIIASFLNLSIIENRNFELYNKEIEIDNQLDDTKNLNINVSKSDKELGYLSNKIKEISQPITTSDLNKARNLGALNYLNDLVLKKSNENPNEKYTCDFLISPNEDLNVNYETNRAVIKNKDDFIIEKFNKHEGLNDKSKTIRSEVYYNPKTKTYDFICREVDQSNRNYDCTKIMLKNWLKKKI